MTTTPITIGMSARWIVGLGLACALGGFLLGRLRRALDDRRFICARARHLGVTWLWFESTMAIRRRVHAVMLCLGGDCLGGGLGPLLLTVHGVRAVHITTTRRGRGLVIVDLAWWAGRARVLHEVTQIVQRSQPIGVAIDVELH